MPNKANVQRRQFVKTSLGIVATATIGAAQAADTATGAGPAPGELVAVPNIQGRINLTQGVRQGAILNEAARQIAVNADSDVIVCGGGPAGIAAALASARRGARTTLIEVHGCLGGVWTAGLLGLILDSANKGGIMSEILGKLKDRGGRLSESLRVTYNPEIMKWLLEELCVEAGIRVLYFTRVVGAIREGGRLTTIVTESKAGRQAWAAKAFIDCTGDGDLGAQAGCDFDLGRDASCLCQPMSMCALVTGLDPKEVDPYALIGKGSEAKDRLRELLVANGVTPSYAKPSLFHLNGNLFAMMANHEYGVSAFDPDQVTQATIRARAELNRIVAALRKSGGPFREIDMVATAEQIGIREGRRLRGRYQVTAEDLAAGRTQAEGVCKVTFPVDVHSLDKDSGTKDGYSSHGLKVKPYDIPLAALIAKDVDGLMMAGRCISGDFLAHASYRVTGNAVAMGEAAGQAGAIGATSGRMPHEVEFRELKKG